MLKKIAVFLCIFVFFSITSRGEEIINRMETAGVGEMGEAAESAKKFDESFDFEERVIAEASGEGKTEDGTYILKMAGEFFILL